MARILRLGLIVLTLSAISMIVAPHLTARVGTSAVINAPVVTVRAPFEGEVTNASQRAASDILPGGSLMGMAAVLPPEETLFDIDTRLERARGRRSALQDEIRTLEALADDLKDRHATYHAHRSTWLERRLDEEKARAESLEDRVSLGMERLERHEKLLASGVLPEDRVDVERMKIAELSGQLEQSRARIARLDAERAALADGMALDGPAADEIYAFQRLDEIRLRLQAAHGNLATIDSEISAMRRERARHVARLKDRRTFTPRATGRSVVWEPSPRPGVRVMAGEEVMKVIDCDARFIEVTLPERSFENVSPGMEAEVRLHGSDTWFSAPVSALYGSGMERGADTMLAARPPGTERGQFHVMIDIASAIEAGEGRHCGVGRTADVRFPRLESDTVLVDSLRRIREVVGLTDPGTLQADGAALAADAQ